MHVRHVTAAVVAALALAVVSPCAAQEEIRRPHLDGHTFLSTDLIPEAFVRTSVRNSLGFAQAVDFDYPPVVVDGDTLALLDGSLIYATLDFEVQYAVKDWIGLRVRANAKTRLGTDAAAILLDGITVGGGPEFGWVVRVKESGSTAIAASATLTNATYTRIDIKGFAEDIANGVPDPKLMDDVPTTRVKFGGHFGWAISRPLGLTVLGEGAYGDTPWREVSEDWDYSYGAALDFDAKPAIGIPLGVAFGFKQTSLPELSTAAGAVARNTVLRIAYNAQPDFLIGLDLTGSSASEIDGEDSVNAGGATITMKYYF